MGFRRRWIKISNQVFPTEHSPFLRTGTFSLILSILPFIIFSAHVPPCMQPVAVTPACFILFLLSCFLLYILFWLFLLSSYLNLALSIHADRERFGLSFFCENTFNPAIFICLRSFYTLWLWLFTFATPVKCLWWRASLQPQGQWGDGQKKFMRHFRAVFIMKTLERLVLEEPWPFKPLWTTWWTLWESRFSTAPVHSTLSIQLYWVRSWQQCRWFPPCDPDYGLSDC